MTITRPDAGGPRIAIHLGRDGIEIRQQRPAIARALTGLPVTTALQRIPLLLPICGTAQSVAAARAVAAAQEQPPDPQQERQREKALWHEQARASAWRLGVDWPDLLGEPRQMPLLKQVYQATNGSERGAALGQLTPGLERVDSLDDLLHWAWHSDSLAARVIRFAQDSAAGDSTPEPPTPLLHEDNWRDAAAAALASEPFDPLDPAGSPLEVGPLAMGRDPLGRQLEAGMGSTVVSRLLAQLLDTRSIARGLAAQTAPTELPGLAVPGCATTARGPVFHRVVLAGDGDTVADWRVLAPTDWHFGPRGPVAARLRALAAPTPQRIALLVASYDPCVPWETVPGHA